MTISRPIFNIEVNQNATFKLTLQMTSESLDVSPGAFINITDWNFSGSIKQQYADKDPPYMFFTASKLDAARGIVEFSLSAHQTEKLTKALYYYDFIGTTNYSASPDDVYRILEGKVKVYPGVTDSSLVDLP